MSGEPSGITKLVGRVRSALGWATADRRAEAQGKLEELGGTEHESEHGDDPEAVLDQAELDVRADHGDLAPSAEPEGRPKQEPPIGG